MPAAQTMPLGELEAALRSAPADAPALRAVLALTLGRWLLARGDHGRARAFLEAALHAMPDLRPALRLMQRIEEARGDIRAQVAMLDREIRATRHPREAAALYRERGRLVEQRFRDQAAARQCYEAARSATPQDLAVLRSIERTTRALGDLKGLAAVLEAQADVVEDPEAAAALLHELGLLAVRRPVPGPGAGDLLATAAELLPQSHVLSSDMFRAAEALGDGDLLLRAAERIADSEPSQQHIVLARSAVLLRSLDDAAAATDLLLAAARRQPDNLSLWHALEEAALAARRPELALVAALAPARSLGTAEPTLRALAFHRASRIAFDQADRIPEAVAAVYRAMAAAPTQVAVLEDAKVRLSQRGLWGQLIEVLRIEARFSAAAGRTRTEQADVYVHIGEILADRMGEPEAARTAFDQALAIRPGYRPARDRLERVLFELGRSDEIRRFYRDELERAESAERTVFLLSVLGQIAEQDEDPTEAIGLHVALLSRLPEHLPALQRLARLLARAGDRERLIRVTEQECRLSLRPQRKAKLLHRIGELRLELGDVPGARAAFEQALSMVDDHRPSMEALAKLLRDQGDHRALADLLRRRLLYTHDEPRRVSLHMELAQVLTEHLGQPEAALAELEKLLTGVPTYLPALHAAENLSARLGRWEQLVQLLAQHAEAVSGPRTRALLLHRSAHVKLQYLEDWDGAIGDLSRALDLWPQLGTARVQLLQIYERLGRRRELQSFAEGGLAATRSPAERRALALQLAELTERPISAIQYLAEATESTPDDYVTWYRLARAARDARRFGRQAEALRQVARVIDERNETGTRSVEVLLYRSARADEAAGNYEQADQSYAALLDRNPGHRLAAAGRRRIKERRRTQPAAPMATRTEGTGGPQRALRLVLAAERAERERQFDVARHLAQAAADAAPEFLPAKWLLARLLGTSSEDADIERAVAILDETARVAKLSATRSQAACRAAELCMRGDRDLTGAAARLAQALATAPTDPTPMRGLLRLAALPNPPKHPPLVQALLARVDALAEAGDLTDESLREMGAVAAALVAPQGAVEVLETGVERLGRSASAVLVQLAHAYARTGRWHEAADRLNDAIEAETSPERCAALHYLAGEACEQAARPEEAVTHLLAAADGGYRSAEALRRADRIAAGSAPPQVRAEVLTRLVQRNEADPRRPEHLRALARLYATDLERPEEAAALLRRLLLERRTDIDLLEELVVLLRRLGREDELRATVLSALIQHRMALRLDPAAPDALTTDRAALLSPFPRLFRLLRRPDGVFVATATLEVLAPEALPPGERADDYLTDALPLPHVVETDVVDVAAGELAGAFILDLLQEAHIEDAPAGGDAPSGALMPEGAPAVLVAESIARVLDTTLPAAFVRETPPDAASIQLGPPPSLVVGRRIASAPFVPWARARLARALFRLRLGIPTPDPESLSGLLAAVVTASGRQPPSHLSEPTAAWAARWAKILEGTPGPVRWAPDAAAFFETHGKDAAARLAAAVQAAEDRIAVLLAGDPRPVLTEILQDERSGPRLAAVLSFVLSDEHFDLREALGYSRSVAVDFGGEGST